MSEDQKPPAMRPFARTNKIQEPGSKHVPLKPHNPLKTRKSYAEQAIKLLRNRITTSKSEMQITQLTMMITKWQMVIDEENKKA